MTIYIKSFQKLEIENMDDLVKFSEFADKMIRNNILTPDEVREILGYDEKEADCVFYDTRNDNTSCYLEKAPDGWKEDEIIENDCTTAHYDDTDEWFTDVIRCDNCDEVFMLGGLTDEKHVVGKFCPHCGKKIVNYRKEDKE